MAGNKFGVEASRLIAEFDAKHQREIVASATSLEDGTKKLFAYRAQRNNTVKLLLAYQALLAAGEPTIELYDAKKSDALGEWFAAVVRLGEQLKTALIKLGVDL